MLNLNPDLVNQDKIRKAKRKRILKYAAFPSIILFLSGLFVLRVGVFNISYYINYDNQNYDIADLLSTAQGFGNIIQPYVKYYDGGVAKLKLKKYKQAEEDFSSSLRENPPGSILCAIYLNLSLSIEKQADELFEIGKYDDALVLYSKSQSTLYANDCANKNDDNGMDLRAENAESRLKNKISRTIGRINSVAEEESDNDNDQDIKIVMGEDDTKKLKELYDKQLDIMWDLKWSSTSGYGSSYDKNCGDYKQYPCS